MLAMEVNGDGEAIETSLALYKPKEEATVFSTLPLNDVGLYFRGLKYRRRLTFFRCPHHSVNYLRGKFFTADL